jgi:hypothetical protein
MYNKPEIETQVIKPRMTTKFEDKDFRILSEEKENALDAAVKDIENYISFNHGLGKSESEKDELYAKSKELWEKYVDIFRSINLDFYLTEKQFEYFTEMLRDKIEYDANNIFTNQMIQISKVMSVTQ